MPNVLSQITAPYGAVESFLYDAVVAPAVVGMDGGMIDGLLAEVPAGAAVLEVGCGGGQLACEVARRRPDLHITGLDLSAEQVARARRRARTLGDRVRFVEGSALDLPFETGWFGAAWSVASIKHWPDQRRGLTEMVRVLQPGGLLAVLEADRGCHLDDARAFVGRWRIPAALRPLALMMFRTYVAGQGLDLDDARAHLAALPLVDVRAERTPGAPGVILGGRKRA